MGVTLELATVVGLGWVRGGMAQAGVENGNGSVFTSDGK